MAASEPLNGSSSGSSLRPGLAADLRYAKFQIDGVTGEKHAVFIPDGNALTGALLSQICAALDKDVQVPSLFLCGVSSVSHPSRIATPQLRACPGFAPLVAEAGGKAGAASEGADARLAEVMDKVLEKRLVSAVTNLANAADRTNVWTLSGPQISNVELLLQQSVENGDTDVFRAVAVHMQDKSYMQSEASKGLMKQLWSNAQELSCEAVDYMEAVKLPGDLWDQSLSAHEEYKENGYDYWSFDSLEQKMATGHPITLFPWPHARLFLLFFRQEAITGPAGVQPDWQWTTGELLDREAVPFDTDSMPPMGYVFAGVPHVWQPPLKRRMIQAMKLGNPLVILDNTPNSCKQMSLLVNVLRGAWDRAPLVSCRPFLDETGSRLGAGASAEDVLHALSPAKILRQVEADFDARGMDQGERLSLSDIVVLLDLAKRRPQAFKETVCVLDPLSGSAEQSTAQLMGVFTSHSSPALEPTSTGVQRSLVLKAWNLHLKLVRKGMRLRTLSTAATVLIAALLLLSTALAMFLFHLHIRKLELDHEEVYHYVLLMLPIFAGGLMAMTSSFQLEAKWTSVHMAASMIVLEIYQFLSTVGPYGSNAALNQQKFLGRLKEMVKNLQVAHVREEDLQHGSAKEDDDAFSGDPDLLRRHIESSLYGQQRTCWLCAQLQLCLRWLGGLGDSWSWTALLVDAQEHRDVTGPLSMEAYMEMRMFPLGACYSKWVRSLTQLHTAFQALLLFFLSVSMLLGAMNWTMWIPVSLALATFVSTLSHWLTPQPLIAALNSAVSTIESMDMRWHGTDTRSRHSEASKRYYITTTERVWLAVNRAYARAAWLPEFDDEEDGTLFGAEQGEERAEGLKRERRSRSISMPVTPFTGTSGTSTPREPGVRGRGIGA